MSVPKGASYGGAEAYNNRQITEFTEEQEQVKLDTARSSERGGTSRRSSIRLSRP